MRNTKPQIRKLTTLGTGSGHSALGRGGASHLVHIDAYTLLMDCGEGVSGWMNDLELTTTLDSIAITHTHPDHIAGLPVLLLNMKIYDRTKSLHLYLPEPMVHALNDWLQPVYLDFKAPDAPFQLHVHPVKVGPFLMLDKFSLSAWASDHFAKDNAKNIEPRPAFGFTIDAGDRRLVYTGDVASAYIFAPQLTDKTTLVCEAAHIHPQDVLRLGQQHNVSGIIFVHPDPAIVESLGNICQAKKNTWLAHDGFEFDW